MNQYHEDDCEPKHKPMPKPVSKPNDDPGDDDGGAPKNNGGHITR